MLVQDVVVITELLEMVENVVGWIILLGNLPEEVGANLLEVSFLGILGINGSFLACTGLWSCPGDMTLFDD